MKINIAGPVAILHVNWTIVYVQHTTRNSAVADKPRDAFVQCAMAPPRMCYHTKIGRSIGQNVDALVEQNPQKLRNAGVTPIWDGGCCGWPKKSNSHMCVSTPNLVVRI